jgi:hypothetical protein
MRKLKIRVSFNGHRPIYIKVLCDDDTGQYESVGQKVLDTCRRRGLNPNLVTSWEVIK